MRRSIIALATGLLVLTALPAAAQNATAAGAAQGAATGGSVAGPIGSFVGGVTGAAVGTAVGVTDAVTAPLRPRSRFYHHRGARRMTCVTRPNGVRRCRTVRY